jgi:hypothetical protein
MAVNDSEDEGKRLETDEAQFNLSKTKLNLLYIKNKSYLAVNTFHQGFKKQSVNGT